MTKNYCALTSEGVFPLCADTLHEAVLEVQIFLKGNNIVVCDADTGIHLQTVQKRK